VTGNAAAELIAELTAHNNRIQSMTREITAIITVQVRAKVSDFSKLDMRFSC